MRPLRVALLTLIAVTLVGANAHTATASAPAVIRPERFISWHSTGDSYSSGEGIAPAGSVPNDACAQSVKSFGPRAAELLRSQRQWPLRPPVFTACTGARTGDFYNRRVGSPKGSLLEWSKEQLAQQRRPVDSRFDVLTFSFGGNDVRFADLLLDCLPYVPAKWSDLLPGGSPERFANDDCDVSAEEQERRVDALLNGVPTNNAAQTSTGAEATFFGPGNTPVRLPDFYSKLADEQLTDDGVMIIVGYPRLLAASKSWGAWRGDRCNGISRAGADRLGASAERLDEGLQRAVAEARAKTSRRIVFVSQLELFDADGSHALCTRGVEWLNGLSVGFLEGVFRPMRSFHPNELGHEATAGRVAGEVEIALGRPDVPATTVTQATVAQAASPTTSARPAASDPAVQTYAVGSAFDARCVVAWPTAPLRSKSSITMRMSCLGVPKQFLFVDVGYGDPDFPVTPSTGYMRVRGSVVDVARSELGFRTLVVAASKIEFT